VTDPFGKLAARWRIAAGRLPRSFAQFGPVSAAMFPNECRATELFAEIADKNGVEEAERIFNDVVKQARKIVPRNRGRPVGAPRLAILREAIILSIAKMVRGQKPTASDREIARAYLNVQESKKRPKEKDIRRATALLKRARAHKKSGT
jgi:hypothetical protein